MTGLRLRAIATAKLPTGTVTFLFTDIEGSTRLLDGLGRERYGDVLGDHRSLLREVFCEHRGAEVDTEGDAFFVAFATAPEALAAAADGQRALARQRWPDGYELRVRMGLHTGAPALLQENYVGIDVHRAARTAAAAHGGQVLVSQATRELVAGELPSGVALRDLGEHRLKDLTQPQRLYQLVIEGLRSDFPPPRTLENRPTNLPVQPTPLIGRESELQELRLLLGREQVHLVTLTGTGGTGKTRLALQLAAEVIDEFPSGVFFVALAPLRDSVLVVPAIAQTLGVREQAGQPLDAMLREHLADKQMLLVLDNFEHLGEAAASVGALIGSGPNVKALATSREPLHLSGEHTYPVSPLALPDPQRLPSLDTLAQYDAVALFIERAQAANPGFAVTNRNAPAIAEICVRLDGLPLAIELAAARIRVLPPQTLQHRLDQSLSLLIGGARDLDERQWTLRATIDWSYRLLTEAEQRLFAYLSVFAGGCDLEAAEAVCDPGAVLGIGVLDGVTSLVEKSLLRQREGADGEARFWMLETIREYATERLEERPEAAAIRRRHGEYFRSLSEMAAGEAHGGEQSSWVPRLEQELGNFRAALAFWRCDPDSQLTIATSVHPLWWRGRWQEGRDWLDEALATTNQESPNRLRALSDAYYFAYLHLDTERARTLLDEMLALAQRLEDRDSTAAALHGLAMLADIDGDEARAEQLEAESLSFCEGERYSHYPLDGLGVAALFRADYESARGYFQRAVEVSRRFNDERNVASELARLAIVAALDGNEQEALTLLHESVTLARTLDETYSLIRDSLPGFAVLRGVEGDGERALRLIGASEALCAEMGSKGGPVSRKLKNLVFEAARLELEEEQIGQAFEEGKSLTLEEALSMAASGGPDVTTAPARSR